MFDRLPAGGLLHDLLMAVFGYLFLYDIHPSFWTMPTDRWWAWPVAGLFGVGAAIVLLRWRLLARERSST